MASHIRGDDDVLALLNEMTGSGDGVSSNLPETSAANTRDVDDATTHTHNDSSSNKAYTSLLSAYKLSPPTNIHVEIIRHRAHEKFKSNFYELFRNCVASHQSTSVSTNMTSSSTTNKDDIRNQCIRSTINKLWKAMPVHSIWERFQFTLKSCEADCVREVHNQQSNFIQPWCSISATISNDQLIQHLINPSIHEIQAYILHGRNNGTIWEPLLPVSTISSSSTTSGHHEEINQKYKQATLQLLQEEIKFQMRRTFKQLIGPGRNSNKGSEILSLDKLYDTLLGGEDNMTDDGKKRKKKESKKKRKDKHIDNVNKEEYVLQTIYKSTSLTKLTNKLHKKIMYLAEDSYSINFINELSKFCNRLLIEEQHQSNNGGGGMSKKKKKKKRKQKSSSSMPKIALVENDNSTSGSRKTNNQQQQQQLMVSFQGISLRINQVHKNKLYSMYQHKLSTLLPPGEVDMIDEYLQQFPKLLFNILLRYDALEGAGLQSAIPSSVFDYLNSRFGCNFECFASPFNCWLEEESVSSSNGGSSSSLVRGGNFGSVFADTDALFGSRGSFFGMDFVNMAAGDGGGCFQANPPFASEFIQRMCNYMHRFLGDDKDNDGSKNKKTTPLMFVIFVPAWSESIGWKTLSSSPHLTKHILLSQKDDIHYYSEGTQHRRTLDNGGPYRIASFDTSVFFLQNEAAKKKWPLLEDSDDETRLKAAFAMNTVDEKKKVVVKKIDGTQKKKKKTNSKSSVNPEEPMEKQQPRDNASAISDKQKKRKKKHNQGSSKKKRLVSGGNDEMSILQSMGILDESDVSKVEEKGESGKKKKRRHKR